MSKMSKALMAIPVGTLLLAGQAMAANLGALQGVLNGITLAPNAGVSSVNVNTDNVPEGTDSYWQIGGSGGSISTVVAELAGNAAVNTFGIFDKANPANKVQIFAGGDAAGASKVISILGNGQVLLNFAPTGVSFAANKFGYYLDGTAGGQSVFYSDTSLNGDGVDHMLAYQGKGDIIQILPFAPGPWGANEYMLGFEDLTGGGDLDYDDLVVLVESVSPCPTPDAGSTVMLMGLALAGIGALNWRRASKA